jgi:hypothetical protein
VGGADGGQADAALGNGVAVEHHVRAGRSHRPVAGPALDLLVGAADTEADGHPHLGDDLRGTDDRLVRSGVEFAHRHRAVATRAGDHHRGLEGRTHRRQVLRWVGLPERPADGAAVADDRIGNHPLGVAEDRVVLGEDR